MKTITVTLKYLHQAPRKTRRMVDLIRGLPVDRARAQLMVHPRRSSEAILKLLESALAGAKQKDMKLADLYIKEIRVDQGPMIKRFFPRAHGAMGEIQRKMSHIIITLGVSRNPKKTLYTFQAKTKKKKEEGKKSTHKHHEGASHEEEEEKKEGAPSKKGFVKKVFQRKSV